MAENINLAKPLLITTPGVPPIAGFVVENIEALKAIESPWLGMFVYVIEDGKTRRVTSLKETEVGALTRKAIDTFEIVPTQSDLDNKANIDHNHDDSYASKEHTHSEYLTSSKANDIYALKDHNHDGEYVPIGENGKIPSQYINAQASTHVVSNISERDKLSPTLEGERAYVRDASSDETVNSGAAEYIWDGSNWQKISEAESLDLILNWENIQNKPATFPPSNHDHNGEYAPLIEGKIPEENLPEINNIKSSTISLPVPYDQDNDNVSLYLDIGTDPEFTEDSYVRIRMTDHYTKMKVFYNEQFHTLTQGFLGVPEYGSTLSFTIDKEMFPEYIPGNTYFARYTWMDSKGFFGDWKGFIFSHDIADMEPIRTNYENPPTVREEEAVSGEISLDYLEGEIQNFSMSTDVTINLSNVSNVPFGEGLICNIKLIAGTLTVANGSSSQTYTERKVYTVVITNFGTNQIAVTENI